MWAKTNPHAWVGLDQRSSGTIIDLVKTCELFLFGLYSPRCYVPFVGWCMAFINLFKDRLKAGPNLVWYVLLVWHCAGVCATRGGSRGGGGSSDPSVPRSPGASPRRAGRPMGRATTISQSFAVCVWLCVPFSGLVSVFSKMCNKIKQKRNRTHC